MKFINILSVKVGMTYAALGATIALAASAALSATATWRSTYGAAPSTGYIEMIQRGLYSAFCVVSVDLVPTLVGVTGFVLCIDYLKSTIFARRDKRPCEIKGNNFFLVSVTLCIYGVGLYWGARMVEGAGNIEAAKVADKIAKIEVQKPNGKAADIAAAAAATKAEKVTVYEKPKVSTSDRWGAAHGNIASIAAIKAANENAFAKAQKQAADVAAAARSKTLDVAKTQAEAEKATAEAEASKARQLTSLYTDLALAEKSNYLFLAKITSLIHIAASLLLGFVVIFSGLHKLRDFRAIHGEMFDFGKPSISINDDDDTQQSRQQSTSGGGTMPQTNLTNLTGSSLQQNNGTIVRNIQGGGAVQGGLFIDENTEISQIIEYYLGSKNGDISQARTACGTLRDTTNSRLIKPLRQSINTHIVALTPENATNDDIREYKVLSERLEKATIKWRKLNDALLRFGAAQT
jgi:hypothetical protein